MSHPSPAQIAAFRAGRLDGDEILSISDHLVACAQCRGTASGGSVSERARTAFFGEHLSFEVMADSVKPRGGQPLDVDSQLHLDACARCREELRELEQLARAVTPPASRWRTVVPAAVVSAVAATLVFVFLSPDPAPVAPRKPTQSGPGARVMPAETPASPLSPLSASASLVSILRELREGRIPSSGMRDAVRSAEGQHRTRETIDGAVEPLSPSAAVTEEARPEFRWKSTLGEPLTVEVYDPEFSLVVQSPALTRGEWRPPAPLPRRVVLTWQLVTAGPERRVFPAPPSAPARFAVISETAARELAAARREQRTLDEALILIREGMLEAARERLVQLARQRPADRELRAITDVVDQALQR